MIFPSRIAMASKPELLTMLGNAIEERNRIAQLFKEIQGGAQNMMRELAQINAVAAEKSRHGVPWGASRAAWTHIKARTDVFAASVLEHEATMKQVEGVKEDASDNKAAGR